MRIHCLLSHLCSANSESSLAMAYRGTFQSRLEGYNSLLIALESAKRQLTNIDEQESSVSQASTSAPLELEVLYAARILDKLEADVLCLKTATEGALHAKCALCSPPSGTGPVPGLR
jgi:hypothetical protein